MHICLCSEQKIYIRGMKSYLKLPMYYRNYNAHNIVNIGTI